MGHTMWSVHIVLLISFLFYFWLDTSATRREYGKTWNMSVSCILIKDFAIFLELFWCLLILQVFIGIVGMILCLVRCGFVFLMDHQLIIQLMLVCISFGYFRLQYPSKSQVTKILKIYFISCICFSCILIFCEFSQRGKFPMSDIHFQNKLRH